MRIEIKDLTSGEVYDIGPNGATLGRESARTDIAIPDEAISKKHARILNLDGRWYLEDLNSSNGTFIDGGKIYEQTLLEDGTNFSLAQRGFCVLRIKDDDDISENPEQKPNFYGPDSDEISHLSEQGEQPPPLPLSHLQEISEVRSESKASMGLVSGFFQAILYYLSAIPIIAFQPARFVRKGIDGQKWPAMSSLNLFFFALPALLFAGLGVTIAAILTHLISGDFSVGAHLESLLIGLLAGVGSALVTAFLWHPVTLKLIELLGGQSSAQDRTNYAIMFFATSVFLTFAISLQTILISLKVPFIHTLSPLLLVLGTITMSYLIHSWNKHFGISKPAHIVILGLTLVSVLGATVYFGSSVHASVMQLYATPEEVAAQQAPKSSNVQTTSATTSAQATQEVQVSNQDPARQETPKATEKSEPKENKVAPTKTEPVNQFAQQIKPTEPKVEGASKFETFVNKRNAIEAYIKANPRLIRDKKVLRDYSRIWKKTYELREKYRRKKGKRWERERIFSRQKDAEIYDATHELVDRLYERIISQ